MTTISLSDILSPSGLLAVERFLVIPSSSQRARRCHAMSRAIALQGSYSVHSMVFSWAFGFLLRSLVLRHVSQLEQNCSTQFFIFGQQYSSLGRTIRPDLGSRLFYSDSCLLNLNRPCLMLFEVLSCSIGISVAGSRLCTFTKRSCQSDGRSETGRITQKIPSSKMSSESVTALPVSTRLRGSGTVFVHPCLYSNVYSYCSSSMIQRLNFPLGSACLRSH